MENKLVKALKDEARQPDSKVGASIFNKYAAKIKNANEADYRKILKNMERELIDTHPDTFSGDDEIANSFMASILKENKLVKALKDETRQPLSKEFLYMQMLSGIITEGEYKAKLDEYDDFGAEVSSDFAKSNFHFDEEREIFDELNQNFFYDPSTNKVKVFGGAPYTNSFDLASDILGPKYSYEEKREVYDRVMEKWKESQKRFR